MTSVLRQALWLVNFTIRVLCLSALAFPVLAQGADPAELTVTASTLLIPDAELDQVQTTLPPIPEHPVAIDAPSSPVTFPTVGDTCAPHYWIVSSRCSVQNVHERCRGPWGVNVYERTPDGMLHQTSLPSLSSQLVPGVPVCIFAHGSFVQWESQCQEAHALYVRLRAACNSPLQMIFFTWPSDGPYTYCIPVDVAVRGRQADFNGFHLAYVLSQVPASCPVSLIGHSHGTRVVLSTMHMAGGGSIEGMTFPYSMGEGRRYRVVLAAGAIDHNWLNPGEQFGCALNRVECLLNLRNRHDFPLAFYPLHRPFAHRAIARSGFTGHDIARLGGNALKIRECDITDYVGRNHLWPVYYQQPAVIAAILPYAYFF